jgi:solute carrier family 25 aspartate/glutamate transporter 12/13
VSQRAANQPNIFIAIRNQLAANVRREGLGAGLYRGLAPQLIGIAPEKALKLTVNDRLRRFLRGEDQSRDLKLWEEIAAGCGTGCVQVFF